MALNFIRKQRRCGCDCRDDDEYQIDDGIFNPIIQLDTPCDNGKRPPCLYIARFPCNLRYENVEVTNVRTPFRVLCEFPTSLHEYVALKGWTRQIPGQQFVDSTLGLDAWEKYSEYPYACTWAERYTTFSQTGVPYTQEGWWDTVNEHIVWTLNTLTIVGTLRHELGISYSLEPGTAWNCFGPNTLRLDPPLRGSTDWYKEIPGLPQFVCITPGITTKVYDKDCCPNCWQCELPDINYVTDISDNVSRIPSQRLDFIPDADESPWLPEMRGICRYQSDIIQYSAYDHVAGEELPEFYKGTPTREKVLLDIASPMNAGQPSTATVIMHYEKGQFGFGGSFFASVRTSVRYECPRFTCEGPNIFVKQTGDRTFPDTLTLTKHDCFASETNDSGPCPAASNQDNMFYFLRNRWTDHEPIRRSNYGTEIDRLTCCDPWCACMPGYITIQCPGGPVQKQGWQPGVNGLPAVSKGFCTGGRDGVNAPAGPSREYCGTFLDADDGEHEICVVAYCGGGGSAGGAWSTDWYCDGTYVGPGAGGGGSRCPFQFQFRMPTMDCLPGCTGCVAFNMISDLCVPPEEEDCCSPPLSTVTVSVGASDVSCYPGPGSFTLPLVDSTPGAYRWQGDDDQSTRWTLTCTGTSYRIHSPDNNINLLDETSHTCDPAFQINFVEDSGDCIGQVITVTI